MSCVAALSLALALLPSAAFAAAADSAAADAGAEAAANTASAASAAADAAGSALANAASTLQSAIEVLGDIVTPNATLSGSGTSSDPYLIASADDWYTFATGVNSGTYTTGYYELSASIDLSSLGTQVAAGSSSYPFKGVFDGNGYTISGLAISASSNYQGLFGYISGATIENVTVEGSVANSAGCSAGVVGYAYGTCTISNVVNKASVTDDTKLAGGIVGYAAGGGTLTVSGCVNEGAITTVYGAAGIVADSGSVTVIRDCSNSGTISASGSKAYTTASGGIVGFVSDTTTVTRCANTGSVTVSSTNNSTSQNGSANNSVGGIVGHARAAIDVAYCYNTGAISAYNILAVGGVVGYAYGYNSSYVTTIESCYNRGTVTHTGSSSSTKPYLAGIVGYGYMRGYTTLSNCYNAGTISYTGSYSYHYTASLWAGVYASSYVAAALVNCYWLEDTASYALTTSNTSANGYTDLDGSYACVSDEKLKASGMAATLGAAFADDTSSAYNDGYPYLNWQNPEATWSATIAVTLATDDNESTDNAITLTVYDADGNDATSQFTQASGATSAAATYTATGIADGSSFSYTIAKKGYGTVTGSFTIETAPASISVALVADTYSYSLTVSPSAATVIMYDDSSEITGTTSTDASADTITYTYSGLYNSSALSYNAYLYGYEQQDGTATLSFEDKSESITLAKLSSYETSFTVAGVDEEPGFIVYYTTEDLSYGTIVYDSRETDASTPTQATDGTWAYSLGELLVGSYRAVAYSAGYTTAVTDFTVSASSASGSATLTAASTTWDGSSIDIAWFYFNQDETDLYLYSAADLAGLSALSGGVEDYLGETASTQGFYGMTIHLMVDIDLGGANETPAYWTPIGYGYKGTSTSGSVVYTFRGSFDGEGHTISNMLVSSAQDSSTLLQSTYKLNSGLFSTLYNTDTSSGTRTTVCDLTIKNASVSGNANPYSSAYMYQGALAGYAFGVDVENVVVESGSVSTAAQYVGGIVGYSYRATFTNCSSSATVSGTNQVGGIVGYADAGSQFTRCDNAGAVTATGYNVGGIAGYMSGTNTSYGAFITQCSNTAAITSSYAVTSVSYGVGGIVGQAGNWHIDISESFNTGAITSASLSVGGIIGYVPNTSVSGLTAGSISDCYNTGVVTNAYATGSSSYGVSAGGIVGFLSEQATTTGSNGVTTEYNCDVTNCYNTGTVTATYTGDGDSSLLENVGGLFGYVGSQSTSYLEGVDYATVENNWFLESCATYGIGLNRTTSTVSESSGATADGYQSATSETMLADSFVTTLGSAYEADPDGDEALNGGYPILEWQYDVDIASVASATLAAASATYSGEAIVPDVAVALTDGTALEEDTDYTVAYYDADGSAVESIVDAGTYTIVVTGTGHYAGTLATLTFTVEALALSASANGAAFTLGSTSATYTQASVAPTRTLTYVVVTETEDDADDDATEEDASALATTETTVTLVEDTDYTVAYASADDTAVDDIVDAGTYTITATACGNYTGTFTAAFTVEAASIESATIASIAAQTYTGSAIEPELTVTLEGYGTLVEDTDYTVTYANNVEAGTATVTVTGTGNYTGTSETSFTINETSIESGTLTLGATEVVYTGSAITPSVTVTLEGYGTLEEGTDYTVAYADADGNAVESIVDAGTYTVTVTGTGSYSGTLSATLTVMQADIATYASAALGKSSVTYNGADQTPSVTVTRDGTALTLGTDYTVAYADADGNAVESIVDAGTYTVTVTGTGGYTGSIELTFTVAECPHETIASSAWTWIWANETYTASIALTCSYCGTVLSCDAAVSVETEEPDCTNDGLATYTATYTYGEETYTSSRTVVLDALGHDYASVVTDPTCTEQGYTTYTCTVCGYSYVGDYLDELGHDWTNDTYVEATCTEDAHWHYECSRCDETLDDDYESGTATGHSYVGVVTDPTCTEAGYTTYTCSSCDDSYVSDYTDALGHSFTSYVSNGDATCEEDGTKTASCDNGCGTTDTVADEGSATGHSYAYDEGTWEWAEDLGSATYTVTCANDESHTCAYEASVESAISGRTTTYTASAEVEGETYTSEQSVALFEFTDVVEGSWYEEAVYALFDAGYVNGYTDTETGELTGLYGVGDTMTRAQLATIIWRIACPEDYAAYEADYAAAGNKYDCANTSGLSDVSDDRYYTAAVNWAVSEGVITGYTSGKYAGKFRPNASISFQDMCLVIARYAGGADGSYEAITSSQAASTLAGFQDASKVSSYARAGMAWCVDAGLVSGYTYSSGLYLKPAETVARERVATVIYRGLDLLEPEE